MNRYMTAMIVVAALGSSPALMGCEVPPTEIECSQAGAGVTGNAVAAVLTTEGGQVLRVQGTAQHQDGLAITRIRVGDFDVAPDEGAFNYARWTVEIPTALLGEAGSTVKLDVTATDSCEEAYTFAKVETALAPPRAVSALELGIDYPGEESYLPATLAVPASVHVGASGSAAGVPVELSAEGASFLGSNGSSLTLTLAQSASGGTDDDASATAYVTATMPGDLAITATALGQVAQETLRVAGPPVIFPSSGNLFGGSEVSIQVLGDGRLVECDVFAPAEVTVQLGSERVSGVVPLELMRGQGVTFLVAVDPSVSASGELTILCRDAYGQSANASYFVSP